ncbi:DUF2461 family protein [uncultured Actinomyces sp.]|uniref:DUF2461 family protein n=1 Tax=uncultured Actinomyces sp. TaxID=249061 RepID=UPI0028D58989|nr:DUF2461 family protein [uncultured Actinomyces sp.]
MHWSTSSPTSSALCACSAPTATCRPLKNAPRGWPTDHPRINFLKWKGLAVIRQWTPDAWMLTPHVRSRIRAVWAAADSLNRVQRRHPRSGEQSLSSRCSARGSVHFSPRGDGHPHVS